MSDEDKKAVTEAAQAPAAEEVAEPQTEAKEADVASDSTEGTKPESSTGESEKSEENVTSSTEGQKPTRRDRRIHKLIEKLKERPEPVTEQDLAKTIGADPDAPLIRQEEAETGIDFNVLNQRQKQREMLVEQRAKNAAVAEIEYKQSIKEHLQDAESTLEELKDDGVLDEIVAEQYKALNYVTDPYTGKEYFVPRVKMSDIYAKQKKVLDSRIARATADTSVKMAQQSQEMAVRPSATGESGRDHDLEASFEEAKESESTEKWASYLKKLGI